MRTVSLFRHAKSSWDNPGADDFERPLAKRGEKAAPRMGAFMAETSIVPELILCSPARRTRETLELVLPHLEPAPIVLVEEPLYLASAATLLARLRQVEAGIAHVMVIAHDPGLHQLALELSGRGEAETLHALASKFPTAALAVIDFEKARDWSRIRPGAGHLRLFMAPKMLP
jgi:phosphohistidine phosphatase